MKCPICQGKLSASNTVWSAMCADSVIAYCCANFSCPATSMGHRTQVEIHHEPPAQELIGYSFAFVDEKESTEALLLYGDRASNITGLKKIKSYWSNAAWAGNQINIGAGNNQGYYNGQMSFVGNTSPLVAPPQSSGFQTAVVVPHTLTAGNFVGNAGGGAVTLTGGVGMAGVGGAVNISGGNLSDEEDIIKSQFIDLGLYDFDAQVISLFNRFKNLVIFS